MQGRRFCLVSFSYRTLKDVLLQLLLKSMITYGLESTKDFHVNLTDMIVTVKGTQILLRSGEVNPDALRGLNLSDFGIDEAREFPDDSLFMVMLGRIRESTDSQWFISSTTKGRNWVWDLVEREGLAKEVEDRGFASSANLTVVTQATRENTFLPPAYMGELTRRYTQAFAAQELEAKIVQLSAGVINSAWFKEVEFPKPRKGIRFWDAAVSIKEAADFSAGALCSMDKDKFAIHDIAYGKWTYPDLKRKIIRCALIDGPEVVIAFEAAGTQLGFVQDLQRIPELRKYTVRAVRPVGDKLNRALPWITRAEQGGVLVHRGLWLRDFKTEADSFTADGSHAHDDMIDAVSGAYQTLYEPTELVAVKMKGF